MKKQSEMHSADFQKLLALALGDLAVRRTILENKVAEVNQELRSLEKDAELEKLDQRLPLFKPTSTITGSLPTRTLSLTRSNTTRVFSRTAEYDKIRRD